MDMPVLTSCNNEIYNETHTKQGVYFILCGKVPTKLVNVHKCGYNMFSSM